MSGQVKVRLMGLPADVKVTAAIIGATMPVLEESEDQPNRGRSKMVRRYLTVEPKLLEPADWYGCQRCGDELYPDDAIDCSCGAVLCEDCYVEAGHADHDENADEVFFMEEK